MSDLPSHLQDCSLRCHFMWPVTRLTPTVYNHRTLAVTFLVTCGTLVTGNNAGGDQELAVECSALIKKCLWLLNLQCYKICSEIAALEALLLAVGKEVCQVCDLF